MATDLYAISNITIPENISFKYLDKKIEELKALNWLPFTYPSIDKNGNETQKTAKPNWFYEINNEYGYLQIDFSGGYSFYISLYPNIGVITTIYKYSLLYDIYNFDWFHNFRKELYDLVQLFNGTEVIFLADNGCDKLGTYFECMALENKPYAEIKQKMIQDLGQPITDYSQLDLDTLSYSNITEFFLDDFKDIFTVKLLEIGAEGGSFSLYKSKKSKKDDYYYFYKVSEIKYDLEDVSIIKEKPQKFTTFLEAFKTLKKKYKSLFQFYPLYINNEVKQDVLKCLNKEHLQKEKDGKFKIWEDQINF